MNGGMRRGGAAGLAIVVSLGGVSVTAAQNHRTAVEATVREAGVRLADAFATGPVLGRFIERIPGSYVFAPDDRSLPIVTVTNPNRVGTLAVGPLVSATGTLDLNARALELTNYALPAAIEARAAARSPDSASSAPLEAGIDAAASITSRLEVAARPGAQSVESRALDRSSELGRATLDDMARLGEAYHAAVNAGDKGAVDAIVERWQEVRGMVVATLPDGTEYKALYGAPDYYAPWRYDRVFSDAAAVVAIGEPGRNTARCSGVLIAEDLVLTAGHCFAGPPPKEPGELEVWFGYAERPDGSRAAPVRRDISPEPVAPAPDKWADVMQHRFGSSLYDYAVVRFAAPAGEPLLPDVEIIPGRKVEPEPQCLRSTPPQRADALYVVGYPRGHPATVHDNGRVELPYRVSAGEEFNLLRLDVDADFRGKPDHEAVLREFDESYVLDDSGILDWWYFFDIRDGGQPRMGIVADTFRGNSGGPVYDHERAQCVVGILNRGMGDTGARLEADWKVHERVLPIRAILEDLKANPQTSPMLEDGTLRIVE
jgi:Trypsin-like peptidase domain